MENNNKIRDLYEIYLELGHDVFENPFATDDYMFDTSPPSKDDDMFTNEHILEDNYFIACDDTMPPIDDDCNDEYDIFSPPTIEEKINYDYKMPPVFDNYYKEYYTIGYN